MQKVTIDLERTPPQFLLTQIQNSSLHGWSELRLALLSKHIGEH